jgi:hypothetical protein
MPVGEAVRVEGLTELIRAFAVADRGLAREVKSAFVDAGEVVKVSAESKARDKIHHAGKKPGAVDWSGMRLGISREIVYVAEQQRGSHDLKKKRPKFGQYLLDEAMIPALDENRLAIEKNVRDAIDNLNQNAGLIRSLHNI